MLSELINFTAVLRAAGIKTGPGELLDLLKAVELLGTGREEFKWALEAVLVKDSKDREIFDKFYYLFWFDTPRPVLPEIKKGVPRKKHPRLAPEEFSARMSAIKDWLRRDLMEHREILSPGGGGTCGTGPGSAGPGGTGLTPGPGGLVSVLNSGSKSIMLALVRKAMDKLGDPDGPHLDHFEYMHRLKLLVGWAEGEDWATGQPDQAMAFRYQERLKKLERLMQCEVDRIRWRSGDREIRKDIARRSNVGLQIFNLLEREQSEEIKRKLVRLGRRLATRKGYRKGPARSGQVDLRRTARMAGATGGIPLRLYFQDRKPARPELVVLCDLSGSVAPFSKFMLLLLNAMQSKFRRVRSFAFVEAVEEVTDIIRGGDLDVSVNNIYRQTRIWQTGFSDYGEVWKQFRERFSGAVSSKTGLIVMGDARNNYKPDGRDYFQAIAGQAGKVIWLNPAPREKWDREDSIMRIYAPFCDHVFECRNLSQLERVVKKVF